MAPLSYQLLMRSGPTPGKIYELNQGEMTIGRDMLNAIEINDVEISRKHVRLIAQAGGFVIEDLGSTNGTFVNGQRLMGPHLLRPGELIMLGENVGLVYEALEFDPNATQVSQPSTPAIGYPKPAYDQPPAQGYPQPIPQARPSQTAYAGQIPVQPPPVYRPAEIEYEYPPEERRINRTWLFAGLGCLVVMLCMCVAAFFIFDSLNLYCTPPFDAATEVFGFYCP